MLFRLTTLVFELLNAIGRPIYCRAEITVSAYVCALNTPCMTESSRIKHYVTLSNIRGKVVLKIKLIIYSSLMNKVLL